MDWETKNGVTLLKSSYSESFPNVSSASLFPYMVENSSNISFPVGLLFVAFLYTYE